MIVSMLRKGVSGGFCLLMLAHGFPVYGKKLRGMSEDYGLEKQLNVV